MDIIVKINHEVMDQLKEEIDKAASSLCVDIFDRILKSISVEGPPRSDPFTPPHIDSGDLIRSFLLEGEKESLRYQISSDEDYAVFLEFGTITMAPRPSIWLSILATRSISSSVLARRTEQSLPREMKDVTL